MRSGERVVTALDALDARITSLRRAVRDRLGVTSDPLGRDQADSLPYVDLAIALEALDALRADPAAEASAICFAEKVLRDAAALELDDGPEVPGSVVAAARASIAAMMERS